MDKSIIIWDKIEKNYLEKLQKAIIAQTPVKGNDSCFILSSELFFDEGFNIKETQVEILKESHFITILGELSWNGKMRSDFYGLNLIKILREAEIKAPIIVCSYMPFSELVKRSNSRYQLLNTPGVFFCQLPDIKLNIDENNPFVCITKSLLHDINYYVFKSSGRIEELYHDLKNELSFKSQLIGEKELNSIRPKVDLFFRNISKILDSSTVIELNKIKSKYYDEIKGRKVVPSQFLYNYKSDILALVENNNDIKHEKLYDVPWLVLYVEDDQRTADIVEENFKVLGITCITVSSANEAFKKLKLDYKGELQLKDKIYPPNSITVLLSDWRLKSQSNRWHYLQGYDIIEEVFSNYQNLLSFIILTSKKGGIVKSVRELSKAQTSWFAKEDVMDSKGSFNLFTEKVVELGNNIFETLVYRPGLPTWKNKPCHRAPAPLSEYYRQFRLSTRHREMEDEISEISTDFFEQAVTVKEYYDKGKTLQVDSEISPTAQMRTNNLEKEWIVFRDRMAARRIALALYRLEGWDNTDISSVMLSRELGGNLNRPFFSEAICISADLSKNFGDQILREELVWFEKEFGHKINLINQALRNRLKTIFSAFKEGFLQVIGNNQQKKLEYLEKYPFLFEPIEPGNVEYIKTFIESIYEIGKSGYEFQDAVKRFSTQMKALLKNKFNERFFEKFGILSLMYKLIHS